MDRPQPTKREIAILGVLWQRGEASVREVWEALREDLPIVQNTVQAFLRTMEQKGLVTHREAGRTFLYRPARPRDETGRHLLGTMLHRVFGGAVDELVANLLEVHRPTPEELAKLRALVDSIEAQKPRRAKRGRS